MTRKTSLVLTLGALLLAACGGGKEHVDAVEAMEKKACACPDQACVHAVGLELKAWAAKNKETRVSKDNMTKIEASMMRMIACAKSKGEPNADELDDVKPAAE